MFSPSDKNEKQYIQKRNISNSIFARLVMQTAEAKSEKRPKAPVVSSPTVLPNGRSRIDHHFLSPSSFTSFHFLAA
jgi:hypothetical protein